MQVADSDVLEEHIWLEPIPSITWWLDTNKHSW
jgi:hypothetical protein